MSLTDLAIQVLRDTSRTFFIPIIRLPAALRDAVGSAYLCLRAIDEIEDHDDLAPSEKAELLNAISTIFSDAVSKSSLDTAALDALLAGYDGSLPRVTRKLGSYALMAPDAVAPRVWGCTAKMAERMAYWSETGWHIESEEDLDTYTLDVAGRVGLLLTDLWKWHDGTEAEEQYAVGFGRSLQAVNIVRNRAEDVARGVDFFPQGWNEQRMIEYIRKQFSHADAYIAALPKGPALDFCTIPLSLARATLDAIEDGRGKLSREEVIGLVGHENA